MLGKSRSRKLILDVGGVHTYEYFGVAILSRSIGSQRSHFEEISLQGLPTSSENIFRRFGADATTAAAAKIASAALGAVR